MRRLLIVLMALAATACASTGYYQRASGPGDIGYYETRLDENRYRVQYRAAYDDFERAQDFALLRAAELTLQRNYDWFQIVDRSAFPADGPRYAPEYSRTNPNYDPRYDRRYRTGYDDDYRYGDDALAVIDVVMGSGRAPASRNAYEARRVVNDFRY